MAGLPELVLRLALVCMAFAGSLGMTFIILACALYQLWIPFVVVIFYLLSPLPTLLARRHVNNGAPGVMDVAIFLTMGILICSYGLPIVLGRASVIKWSSCYLTMAGNTVIYLALLAFFLTFESEDPYFSGL